MAYSEKVIEHYENPRNVGTLDKGDENVGTGLVGAPACGDVMRLQIKVGDDGVIQDLRLRVRDRVVVARDGVAQGQDGGRGRDDQEQHDRRGAPPSTRQDPLLRAGGGRDQERDRRFPVEAGREAEGGEASRRVIGAAQ